MAAEDVEKLREVYEHWSRGNWRAGTELFADEVRSTTFDADGDEIELNSLEELVVWFRSFLGQWQDFRQEIDQMIDCGDRVFVAGRQSAAGRASGVRLEMSVFNVWVFEDGKVVEFHTTRHEGVARRKAGLSDA